MKGAELYDFLDLCNKCTILWSIELQKHARILKAIVAQYLQIRFILKEMGLVAVM